MGLMAVAVITIPGQRVIAATEFDLTAVKNSGIRRLPEEANLPAGEMLDINDLPNQPVALIECNGGKAHVLKEVQTHRDSRSLAALDNRIAVGTSSGEVLWIDMSSFSIFAETKCGAYSNGVKLELAKNGEPFKRRLRFSTPFKLASTFPT